VEASTVLASATIAAAVFCAAHANAPPKADRFGEAVRDAHGVLTHTVASPRQKGLTKLRVLMPDGASDANRLPVVYVLPVEAGDGRRWGEPVAEVRKLGLHNRHRLIFVYPTFSHTPWYANHPTNKTIRQETYLLKTVLPFVERTYPARRGRDGRMLLGFSKSGWGAWSLLLRHPDMFARAAAWDAPLTVSTPKAWGMKEIFATQANFEPYRITSLLDRVGAKLGDQPRLVLTGYDNFRAHHVKIHEQLLALKVPHVYRDGPRRRHHWNTGWLAEAVELLARPAK
jgi:hypothetical protein